MTYPNTIRCVLEPALPEFPNSSPRATFTTKEKVWKYQNGKAHELPVVEKPLPVTPTEDNPECVLIQLNEDVSYIAFNNGDYIHKAFNYTTDEKGVTATLENMAKGFKKSMLDDEDKSLFKISVDFAFVITSNKEDVENIKKILKNSNPAND